MKKILILLLLTLFSFVLIAQERELSDYEKYRMQKEAEMLGEITVQDTIHDTVYVEAQESEPVIVNNYYVRENQPNLRFLLTFGGIYRPFYQPYYGYYDPLYYDWYYGYDPFYYDWYYWSWNWYIPNYYTSWYHRPYYRYYNHSRPYYSHTSRYYNGRHMATNTLGWNRDYYRPNYKQTVGRSSTARITPKTTVAKNAQVVRKPAVQTTRTVTRTSPDNRAYKPTYNKPRTSVRSQFNQPHSRSRSTSATQQRSTEQRTYNSTPQRTTRSTFTRPSSSSRSTYQAPSTAPSRSYSAPSRAPSRSSSSYRSSGSVSRSSGSMSRSSGSVSRSSGGSRSSGRR